ncbi:MAG: hypothetical protein JKY18_13840, partial [Flavobacteriales bacterium]|nr:hypothetical protein [Flavobacteriales bacterium]
WTATGGQTTTFDLCIGTPPPPPANDDCSGAIALTVNPDQACGTVTAGTIALATASSDANSCSGTDDDDVWYSFVATSTRHYVDLLNVAGSTTDLYHAVFTGVCGSLGTAVNCSDPNSSTLTGLTIGDTYYIRVYTLTATGGQTTTFDLCIGTPPVNDDCSGAIALTVNPDRLCGTVTAGTIALATASSDANSCSGTDDDDVWFSFVATTTTHHVDLLNVAGSATDLYHAVFTGTCGSLGTAVNCSDPNSSTLTGLTIGDTYYVRVYTWTSTGGQTTTFDLCIGTPFPPVNDPCSGAVALTVNGVTCVTVTSGFTLDATQSIAGCVGTADDDVWYSFVATNIMHDFELTNITGTSTNLVHEVLSGTCGSLTSVSCSDPNTSSVTGLTIGDTYYVRVYTFFSGDEASNFDLCVTDPCIGGAPANDNPCTATSLAVGASCTFSSYTNACTNDSGEPNPGCASYAGADAWFTAVVPASGHLIVDCNTGGVTDGGMAFYTGTCSSLTFLECDDDDSPNGLMPMLDRCNLTPGSVVYIRFWEYAADNNGTFSICAYDGAAPGACSTGQVIASLPFAQTGLTTAGAGDDFSSFDICSSSYMNGDDYVFEYTCTADEDITITLTNTGTSVGVFVTEGCPDNICSICVTENSALGCGNGSGTNTNSAGNPFGTFSLNAGNTYYITVSTNPAPQATAFDIDITTAPPGVGGVVPQQDCVVSEPVCGSTISAPNPGFSGTGNNCDFDGSGNCLLTGEKESAWYLIDISGNGTLYFNLVATDATTSSCGTETDYDFAIWKVAGTGATDCATIQSTGGAGVLACNYNPDGVTGCAPGGNAPSPYSACFDAAFEPGVAVLAGEQFLLVVQNWTVNSSGFDLDFSPTAAGVINYSAPTTVLWKGSNGTDWTDPANWGSCGIPSCTVDANIAYSSTGQPVLTVNATAKDVTINSGATLTINAGVTLTVCGNFTNNGTLIAASGSIIEFTGTGTQNITGTLTGVNKMSNMTVNKSSGSVILNDNVEIEQVTTLSSGEVNLNGNSLIILNGATTALTRTSGYIISQSESGV